MSSYGDWIKIHDGWALEKWIDVMAEQAKLSLRQLHMEGKLQFPISFGWKAREITPEDEAIAGAWLKEQETQG